MKLINRYNRIYLPVLLLIFLISGTVSYFLIRQAIQNELDSSIIRVKRKVKNFVAEQHQLPVANSLNNEIIEFQKINDPIADTGFHTIQLTNSKFNKHHLFRQLIFLQSVNKEIYKVTITSALEGTSQVIRVILIISISTMFLIIIISAFFNRYLLSKLWLPFYESLQLLSKFKIDRPVPFSFPKTHTTEFNFMIQHLKALTTSGVETYQILKEFSENASHEIQTPLAIIRSKLDILIQNEQLSGKESETAKTVYGAIDKLSRLSQSLLLITKIGNSQFENKIIVPVTFRIQEKLTQFAELWETNNIQVTSNLAEAEIIANEELIDILLNNLLSNATKHNIINGKIFVALKQGYLLIRNTGRINPLDPNKLFKRFYKDAQHSENNGLGLSIIKQICDESGIKLSYEFKEVQHEFLLLW